MAAPDTVNALTEFGRTRLSKHFFMREMLYSEVANFHGIPNIPQDPDLAIAAATRLCEDILEPLYEAFGHVTVRSAYRSAEVNGYCNARYVESGGHNTGYYCSDNTYNAGRHIWDKRDEHGYMGATASIVIPWYLPQFEQTADPRPLAWWIKDNIPAYAEMMFFPWMCAFNIRWYEGPASKAIYLDDGIDTELLTHKSAANFSQDNSALYRGFPPRA